MYNILRIKAEVNDNDDISDFRQFWGMQNLCDASG